MPRMCPMRGDQKQNRITSSKGFRVPSQVKFTAFLMLLVLPVTAAGILTFIGMVQNGVGNVDGIQDVVAISVSPDGQNLYAVGRLDHAVAVFSRDIESGALSFQETHFDGVAGVLGLFEPSDIAVSPDGRNVYVVSDVDDSVVIFARNLATGSLQYVRHYQDGVDGIHGINGANSVAVSPDGTLVLVTGRTEDTLATFSRDIPLDDLVLVDVDQDGVEEVDDMAAPSGVAISPDGQNVYVTAELDDSVVVFTRDPTQDAVHYRESVWTPEGPSSVVVNGGGDAVYVTGAWWFRVHSRNLVNGSLLPTWFFADGVHGVGGLDGARDVIAAPTDAPVFVAGAFDDAVAVFDREWPSGELAYLEAIYDGVDGVEGIGGAHGLALSPDGRFLYVAGANDNAISIFVVTQVLFTGGFDFGDTSRWSATVP